MKMFPKVCLTPRTMLVLLLLAAAGTFVLQAAVSFGVYDAAEKERLAEAARIDERQSDIERRLVMIERAATEDKRQMEVRLKDISERQEEFGADAQAAVARSPFPVDDVITAIVELVCLDNADDDVYYSGSGTIVGKDGLIVTNRHLLLSADGSIIRYCGVGFTDDIEEPPKIEYVAEAMAVHDRTDLALLRIIERLDGADLPGSFPSLDIGAVSSDRDLDIGDPIYIAGYPGIGAETFTFTEGVVSGRVGKELIKTSALIDSGTSGGAVFDAAGTYVGVPTAAARGDIGGSLGYLIGAHVVDSFLADYFAGLAELRALEGTAE